ncbi:MAG: NAD(P)H-dependent oxidoreductase [Calditrichaeota bacterium]|nr:NAD(P)H-dependent oxidoreductase [Calditrichota bacterium]
MHVLNILSSHYPQSFNSVLMDAFNKALSKYGHTYETIDLYQINFDPVMKGDDFNQFMNKPIPAEILNYQEKIKVADVITFFYPVWWCDMPAIMKGWIDRVFAKGFAYDINNDEANGLLVGKKAILVCTLGNKTDNPNTEKLEDSMRFKYDFGVFEYCGFESVNHHFLYDVYASEAVRNNYLKLMNQIAEKL